MNETIKSIAIIVFICALLFAGYSFYSAGKSVDEVRARAERAEAELEYLRQNYSRATAELRFFADGVRQSANRVGRVSDEISSGVNRSISVIGELRETNRAIEERFNNIVDSCGCAGGRDSNKIAENGE